MLRGLWRLTWIEMKIFFREPLGVIGAVFIPILVVVLFGRMGAQVVPQGRTGAMSVLRVDVPVLAAVLIALRPELRAIARAVPLTYSVSLLRGIWNGDTWSAHTGDIAALVLVFIVCTALSAKVFRWE